MQFFRIRGNLAPAQSGTPEDGRRVHKENRKEWREKCERCNRVYQNEGVFFLSSEREGEVSAGVMQYRPAEGKAFSETCLQQAGIELTGCCIEEITIGRFRKMLKNAERSGYIEDIDEILEKCGLDDLMDEHGSYFSFQENLISPCSKREIYQRAESYGMGEDLLAELDRIYAPGPQKRVYGHPVHYLIQTEDSAQRKEMYQLLLQALYQNHRLCNKRYCIKTIYPKSRLPWRGYDALCRSCIGGTLIVIFQEEVEENQRKKIDPEMLKMICKGIRTYKNQVLTILCIPCDWRREQEILDEELGETPFVAFRERYLCNEEAEQAMLKLVKKRGVRKDKRLFSHIERDREYSRLELEQLFDQWYDEKLRTVIYKQYKGVTWHKGKELSVKSEKSAYEKLMRMAGLEEAKQVIDQILNYGRLQKQLAAEGIGEKSPTMHMVFTGNPGTAKTTAARLFAEILKENGLLSSGRFVEAGRSDLVAKYVGWTAPNIRKKFQEAEGGILFIDEAYSLIDDREGSYGDEAINTIVQEMENHRETVIVIFAGYPAEMEDFLQKNPGLRSRIAFHVPFADYTVKELCKIAELIGEEKGVRFTSEAKEKLYSVLEQARLQENFGNGRFVRNLIERSKMAQATRVLEKGKVTADELRTITAEDIEFTDIPKREKRQIGFHMEKPFCMPAPFREGKLAEKPEGKVQIEEEYR